MSARELPPKLPPGGPRGIDFDPSSVEDVLRYIQKQDYVSFAELKNRFRPLFEGTMAIAMIENAYYWVGMSDEIVKAMIRWRKDRLIAFVPCQLLVYVADGAMLQMPLVKRRPRGGVFKKEHWIPVTIRPAEKMDDKAKKAWLK